MTKLKLVVASAALIIAGLGASAFAKDDFAKPTQEARKAMHEKKQAEMLSKFDANKDGTLDDSERAVMRDARIAKRFAMLDTNKDGAITLDEMKANAGKGHHGKRGGHRHRGFGAPRGLSK